MKKVLLLAGLAVAGYMLFGQKNENADADDFEETTSAFRELTDAEAQNYLNQNIDLQAAYKGSLEKAKEHWRNWGWEKEFMLGTRPSPYLS